MKKNRWICLAAACLLSLLLPLSALAAVPSKPMEAFYVNDYADVISAEDEAYISQLGAALDDETTAQVVAVAVTWLDGMDIEQYAYDLFNAWGIGDAEKNNGVLLLVAIGDRGIHTVVGRGLEDQLPESVTGAYTDDYAIAYLEEDDFSTGIRENYKALVDKVASIYGVSLSTAQADTVPSGYTSGYDNPSYQDNGYRESSGGFDFGGIMSIIIGIIVVVVVLAIIGSIFRSAGNGSGCLFGWLLGRGSRPRNRWGGGWGRGWGAPPPPPGGGMGPRPPRSRPSGGRSTGGFGGGGFGGGGRSSGGGGSRPRSGGGGSTRGGGSSRKF